MIPVSLSVAYILVLAPCLVFALGFLEPVPGALAALLAAAPAIVILRRTDWRGRPEAPLLGLALAVAAILTGISGVGHFFWQTDDWMVRDAMLFDLVRHPWPVPYDFAGGAGLLRAPLGMYLVPALLGQAAGLGAAQAALFAQNTLLIGISVYIFARALPAGRARFIMVGLFVAFSGMDCIAWGRRMMDGLPGLYLPHIEPWAGFFQYASNVTEIFWTPHHAIAGWILVAAYLVWRSGRIPALAIGPMWAASIFWSPLAALGALPFLAFAFVCDALDRKLRLSDFALAIVAGAAAIPVLFYLTRDSAGVEKGFLDFTNPEVLRAYVALIALEVLPYLSIAWQGRDAQDRRSAPELLLVAASLIAIPFYKLGFANDFAMRVSIPALMLLCVRAVPGLAALGREPLSRRAIMVSIVALGAVTPGIEIARNISQTATPASACNVLESLQDGPFAGSPLDYYIASQASFQTTPRLFRPPTGAPVTRQITKCWPGRTFVYGPPETR